MKRLCVLGSTGSIGCQTLEVVRANPGQFEVAALVAGSNVELLAEQIREFSPETVVVADDKSAAELRGAGFPHVRSGRAATEAAAASPESDIVVGAIVGFEGLFSVLAAVKSGKKVAVANKECLVAAGSLLLAEARRSGAELVPVDSEHSSIYQCLNRRGVNEKVRRITLTASGGPFLNTPLEKFASIRPEDALKHPTWSMGAKISVDSATLMNKGLEVIEAAVLFDLPPEKIEVLIHPESAVHGLVEYTDGTSIAALFETDMRVPIAYALKSLSNTTQIIESGVGRLDLAARRTLSFFEPDRNRFPALTICYRALELGGTSPALLNAANEVAVMRFLSNEIGFLEIASVVQEVLELIPVGKIERIEDVVAADAEAREMASNIIDQIRLKARKQG